MVKMIYHFIQMVSRAIQKFILPPPKPKIETGVNESVSIVINYCENV